MFAKAQFQDMSHWLVARLQLGSNTRGGQGSYWRFRIVGDVQAFKRVGGFFSVTDIDMKKEFCDAMECDLKHCVSDEDCEVAVKLVADNEYLVSVFGMSQKKGGSANALVSLEFKPPSQCKYSLCDVPSDINTCEMVSSADMPWFPVTSSEYPDLMCGTPTGAEVVSVVAETKPFCLMPDAFSDNLEDCWPKPKPNTDDFSCQGLHDALGGGALSNVVVASQHLADNVDFLITRGGAAADGNETDLDLQEGEQRCLPVQRGEAGNEVRKVRCALMDLGFDKTACKDEAAVIPGINANCAAVLAPSADTPARESKEASAIRYSLIVNSVTGKSASGELEGGNIVVDSSNVGFDAKARRGNFAYDFRRLAANGDDDAGSGYIPAGSSKTSFLLVKELGYATDEADPGTVLFWMRKDSAALADDDSTAGETIATLLPTGKLVPSPDDASLSLGDKATTDASRVTMGISRGGVLWLRIYTLDGSLVCGVKSPHNKGLTEGLWNHVGFVMRTEPLRPWVAASINFFVNGGVASVTCPNPPKGGPPFSYKDHKTALYRQLLVGVDFNAIATSDNSRFEGAFDGAMDDFEVFGQALSTGDIAMLSVSIPCARGFVGDGFTFFRRIQPLPDGTAPPQSSVAIRPGGNGLDKCSTGIYTLSFRYLRSSGNNHILQLTSGGETDPVVVGNTTFKEEVGFSDVDVITWSHTNPIVLDMRERSLPQVNLVMEWSSGKPEAASSTRRRRALLQSPALLGDASSDADEEELRLAKEKSDADTKTAQDAKDQYEAKKKHKAEDEAAASTDATDVVKLEPDGPVVDSYSLDTGASYLRSSMLARSWQVLTPFYFSAQHEIFVPVLDMRYSYPCCGGSFGTETTTHHIRQKMLKLSDYRWTSERP